VASKPWTIGAAGGTADAVYADMYTGIETMIGVTVTVIGGGIIATGRKKGLSGKIQRAPVA